MALFATGGLTNKVRHVWDGLPIPGDPSLFERNPFVNDVMRGAGAQQRQQTIRRLYANYETYFQNYANDPNHNPPGPSRYQHPQWVQPRISFDRDAKKLRLGGGRSAPPIYLDWPFVDWPAPRNLMITRKDGEYMAVATYDSEKQDLPDEAVRTRTPIGDKTAGIDLGETYLAAADDGSRTILLGGGKLKELRQLQNNEKRRFSKRIDRKQKGSSRWWKMVKAKKKRLSEIRNRIDDLLHKMSTRLVEELWQSGVSEIVYGDLTGIREGMDYGSDMNRRLHQWAFRQFIERVEYKADRCGMTVESRDEAYTSSICPHCGSGISRRKRHFRCRSCGLEGHADALGALNIRRLYLHGDTQDPASSEAGHLEAVRATATDKGAASRRKTRSLLQDHATALTRATARIHSPTIIRFDPHMGCVAEG